MKTGDKVRVRDGSWSRVIKKSGEIGYGSGLSLRDSVFEVVVPDCKIPVMKYNGRQDVYHDGRLIWNDTVLYNPENGDMVQIMASHLEKVQEVCPCCGAVKNEYRVHSLL